jgi:hypothetical protein
LKKKKTICIPSPIPNQSPLNDTNGGGEVSWYWARASFVRPRFVGRCWFQRPRSKLGRHCAVLVCLPTALPYTATITSDGPLSAAPWADEDQAPGVQPTSPGLWPGGRRCSARTTDHRWITCPAGGGPEATAVPLVATNGSIFFQPPMHILRTAVGVLNSFMRAYPSIVRCDGRRSWFLMDVSSPQEPLCLFNHCSGSCTIGLV